MTDRKKLERFIRLDLRREPSLECYALRFACGLARIIDGVVSVTTLTMVSTGLTLECARQLARARFEGGQA